MLPKMMETTVTHKEGATEKEAGLDGGTGKESRRS
jgi:hypothetical protein